MNERISALLRDLEAAIAILHSNIDKLVYYLTDLANLRLIMQSAHLRQAHLIEFEPGKDAGAIKKINVSDMCSVELLIGELIFKAKDCLYKIDREYASAVVQRMVDEIDAQEKRNKLLRRLAQTEHVRRALASLGAQIEASKGSCRFYTTDLLSMTRFIEHDTCYVSIKKIRESRVDEVAVVKWWLLEGISTDFAAASAAAGRTSRD